jgi:hypothetical protein
VNQAPRAAAAITSSMARSLLTCEWKSHMISVANHKLGSRQQFRTTHWVWVLTWCITLSNYMKFITTLDYIWMRIRSISTHSVAILNPTFLSAVQSTVGWSWKHSNGIPVLRYDQKGFVKFEMRCRWQSSNEKRRGLVTPM